MGFCGSFVAEACRSRARRSVSRLRLHGGCPTRLNATRNWRQIQRSALPSAVMAGAVELPRVLGGFPACAPPATSFVSFEGAGATPGLPPCSFASNSSTRFWSRSTLSSSSSTLSNSNCSRSVSPDSALVVLADLAADVVRALLGFASSALARPVLQTPRLSSVNIPIPAK